MLTKVRRLCTVNIRQNCLMTCLSLCTMCLLITTAIIIITIISITPIIILGLGQITAGQRDLILSPTSGSYMNCTKMTQLSNMHIMPRLKSFGSIDSRSVTVWFIDFELEQQQHLGTLSAITNNLKQYVYMHNDLGKSQGQNIELQFQDQNLLVIMYDIITEKKNSNPQKQSYYNAILQQLTEILRDRNLQAQFNVKETFSTSMGKFPLGVTNNYIYIDINTALQHFVRTNFQNKLSQSKLLLYLQSKQFNLRDYSTEATVNIPNRIEVYSNPDYEQTYRTLSSFASKTLSSFGIFAIDSSMPIASSLILLSYFGMFIGVILKVVIISLFILSVIMMNNMLVMGIQRKNFDFALLKTMGANRFFIITNLLSDSLKYVFLANIVAFPFAYGILSLTSGLFYQFFGYNYQITPTFGSIIGGFFIGVFVPIVSAVIPIWSILQNDLVQNLNPTRNKTQAIHTEIYIQGREFPYGKFIFGLLTAVYGIMIYYLLPLGLLNKDIALLLIVFFAILQGLLVGLILLSYSFQYLIEKIVAYALLFWINKTDFVLMLKNLSAHRFKNRRSSIMYALSVSFIVFTSVGISIQMQVIYNDLLKKKGSFVQISIGQQFDKNYYDQMLSTQSGVTEWAYQTLPLSLYLQKKDKVKDILVSDKARIFFTRSQIYGVSPNIMNPLYYSTPEYVRTDSQSPYDAYSYLYSSQGRNTTTISKYVASKFNILSGNDKQYLISIYWTDKIRRQTLSYSTVFDKRAGLKYTPFSFGRSNIGVSFDTFRFLGNIPSSSSIPYHSIKIGLANQQKASQVSSNIRKKLSDDQKSAKVWDYTQIKETIEKIKNLLNNVLNILLVIVLTISFFSLIVTCYLNMLNQTTQIGILLTLGYSKLRIVKIYIYQSFVLVFSSCLIGVFVGYFVAWMMGLQRELFDDFPIVIELNYMDIIIIAAIISSLLSTIAPFMKIFNKTISQIINYAK